MIVVVIIMINKYTGMSKTYKKEKKKSQRKSTRHADSQRSTHKKLIKTKSEAIIHKQKPV